MLEFVSVLPTTGDSGWLGTLKPDRQPSFDVLRDAALTAEGVGFEACLITTGHTSNHISTTPAGISGRASSRRCSTRCGHRTRLASRAATLPCARPGAGPSPISSLARLSMWPAAPRSRWTWLPAGPIASCCPVSPRIRSARSTMDDTVAEGGYLLRGKETREHHKPVLGEVTLPSIHGLRRHGGGQAASVVHHPRLRAPGAFVSRRLIGRVRCRRCSSRYDPPQLSV
jgi:hypothetical protein